MSSATSVCAVNRENCGVCGRGHLSASECTERLSWSTSKTYAFHMKSHFKSETFRYAVSRAPTNGTFIGPPSSVRWHSKSNSTDQRCVHSSALRSKQAKSLLHTEGRRQVRNARSTGCRDLTAMVLPANRVGGNALALAALGPGSFSLKPQRAAPWK